MDHSLNERSPFAAAAQHWKLIKELVAWTWDWTKWRPRRFNAHWFIGSQQAAARKQQQRARWRDFARSLCSHINDLLVQLARTRTQLFAQHTRVCFSLTHKTWKSRAHSKQQMRVHSSELFALQLFSLSFSLHFYKFALEFTACCCCCCFCYTNAKRNSTKWTNKFQLIYCANWAKVELLLFVCLSCVCVWWMTVRFFTSTNRTSECSLFKLKLKLKLVKNKSLSVVWAGASREKEREREVKALGCKGRPNERLQAEDKQLTSQSTTTTTTNDDQLSALTFCSLFSALAHQAHLHTQPASHIAPYLKRPHVCWSSEKEKRKVDCMREIR